MRLKARTDENQTEIVKLFRKLGYSVHHTHMIGQGFPDLVVGNFGHNYLIEIKDGKKVKSKQSLTDDENDFRLKWKGQYTIINSVNQLLEWDFEVRTNFINQKEQKA